MVQNRWAEMFPSIISRAEALEMLSTGVAGSYDGAIQLVYANYAIHLVCRDVYLLNDRSDRSAGHLLCIISA